MFIFSGWLLLWIFNFHGQGDRDAPKRCKKYQLMKCFQTWRSEPKNEKRTLIQVGGNCHIMYPVIISLILVRQIICTHKKFCLVNLFLKTTRRFVVIFPASFDATFPSFLLETWHQSWVFHRLSDGCKFKAVGFHRWQKEGGVFDDLSCNRWLYKF